MKIKREDDSESDDDLPLVKAQEHPKSYNKNKRKIMSKKIKKSGSTDESSSSEDQKPLINLKSKTATPKVTNQKKRKTAKNSVKEEDEDVKPIIKRESSTRPSSKSSKKSKHKQLDAKVKKEEDEEDDLEDDEDEEGRTQRQEEKDEAQYRWWEENKDDGSKRWTTLEHNGVLFPPPYAPLPKTVKMKYDGKPVDLPPESEEVAGFFGGMLNSDHCQKPVFCANFFRDFREVLKEHPPRDGTKIEKFEKCDFGPIFEYYESERQKKRSLTSQEKKALKAEKDKMEEKYMTCILDGRKEKVGNFRVEPPSLFRGRGEHPKTGSLKTRIQPESISINCSAGSKVPEPPPGHRWKEVVHLDTACWLATWKENINGSVKYVFLAPSSSLKGQSDLKKFEKARNLKHHIERIRADYRKELTDNLMATRQRATATYLIDKFALRAGNEKTDEEADTFGCCSLRCSHLTLEPPTTVIFDFLGKDSIRFFQRFDVDEQVFKNLRIFKKNKGPLDDVFDRLTTVTLNKHLSDYMQGLTAKVFRTYNASFTFEQELEKNMKELKPDASVADKIYAYNKANRQVAVLCNHQRTVSKNHDQTMGKAYEKIRAMKYQRRKLRLMILTSEGLDKKVKKMFEKDVESDLDEEWMVQHEEEQEAKEKEKAVKAFERYNEDAVKKGNAPKPEAELKKKLKDLEGYANRLRQERKKKIPASSKQSTKSNKAAKPEDSDEDREDGDEDDKKKVKRAKSQANGGSKGNGSGTGNGGLDNLVKAIGKIDQRILAAKVGCKDKDEGKETSLGTSKLNYIDPRLTFAWCKKYEVPVTKLFAKTLREKFHWAEETPADWRF
ncbi:hypothetical protein BY996DRAFT_6996575 [Phakopsora pachyrhizi]|nr:hypothetical protein BY996DRAFT_6996575 [Phakopsora pachyrhizi]